MTEAILRNYWLFTMSCTIIGVVTTIFIFRYKTIAAFLRRKITFILQRDKCRDTVYEVMKELQPLNKRYIRQQVREYLKELQKAPSYEEKKTTTQPPVTVKRRRTRESKTKKV
tara:strand:+ start:213 stop:551 length:339 start_codon:yes stop_codon:yes gene_type:complete